MDQNEGINSIRRLLSVMKEELEAIQSDMTAQVEMLERDTLMKEELLHLLTDINATRDMEDLRKLIFETFSRDFPEPWGLEVAKDDTSPPFLRLYSETADLKKGRRKLVKNLAHLAGGYVVLYLSYELDDDALLRFTTLAAQIYPAADRFRMGLSDQKTHLWNAGHFQFELEREVARAERHRQALSVIFIDLDGFKELNDLNGHGAGDQALSEVADILMAHHRLEDTIARWGGDEFIVVLPQTGARRAYIYAEQIRKAIENHRFEGANGERRVKLTASIGVASRSKDLDTAAALIKAADQAMYVSKEWGKNRVTGSPRALIHSRVG